MKEINIVYSLAGSYRYPVDLDEYEEDILDTYGKPWEELTKGEKLEFVYELGIELFETAEAESDYPLEAVESYEDGDEDFYF